MLFGETYGETTIFFQEDKYKVSLKIPSLKAYVYVLSRLPGVCFFKDEPKARKSLKAFFYSQKYI